jgi:bifunctional enzyme CysN/CysC
MDVRPAAKVDGFLRSYERRELLRFLTCGSVDDGKSTLIGRLLHDSGSVYDDQLAAVRKETARRGNVDDDLDFSLLVDGLEAEREQGITIDVAYRYFSTPKRNFIIADTPGHEQYTRNMATGASNCNLAIILVDGRLGMLPQTRRHAFITSLLGIKHLVVAVNKMDLVDFSQDRFEEIRQDFAEFAAKLQVTHIEFIPLSALKGDNVVSSSDRMPWYHGRPLLDYLETVHIASDLNLIDLRFPVQLVLRPSMEFRGYSGTIVSGVLRRGDEVVVVPSLQRSRISTIVSFDGELEEAFAPMAVTITLADDLDVSRGDMIVHVHNVPELGQDVEAMLVWMSEEPLVVGRELLIKHTTVQAPASVGIVRYRINVNTLHREQTETLTLNEIGRVRIETPRVLAFDAYSQNRLTGAFILIDRISNATVAAGMIMERESADTLQRRGAAPDATMNVRSHGGLISAAARAARLDQEPFVIWLTGLPRSGKSSVAYLLEQTLFEVGYVPQVLDGENLRLGVSSDLGFSDVDRTEAVQRAAAIARLSCEAGLIAIVALVSPKERDRRRARELIGVFPFVEIYCSAPLEVCERRDSDGLFARARAGEFHNVTGVGAPYEVPASPDLILQTDVDPVDRNVERVIDLLHALKLIR